MFFRCHLTVSGEMPSVRAIFLFGKACASRRDDSRLALAQHLGAARRRAFGCWARRAGHAPRPRTPCARGLQAGPHRRTGPGPAARSRSTCVDQIQRAGVGVEQAAHQTQPVPAAQRGEHAPARRRRPGRAAHRPRRACIWKRTTRRCQPRASHNANQRLKRARRLRRNLRARCTSRCARAAAIACDFDDACAAARRHRDAARRSRR